MSSSLSLFRIACLGRTCRSTTAMWTELGTRATKLPRVLSRSVFTTCCWNKSEADKSTNKPLKQWTLIVNPFGTLKVRLPCDVAVRPLDPHRFPDADRAFVTVSGGKASSQGLDLDNVEVKYDEVQNQMQIFSDNIASSTYVAVTAPVKFDLDINTSGTGNVKIKNMESDSCRVETEYGTSILHSLKSQSVHVKTKGGNVIGLGTVYGNVEIYASNKSMVNINKLQGTTVAISTEDGELKTKYLYAESSCLSAVLGGIELGSVHGDVTVQTKAGNITVDSSDGCLKASTLQGDIDVYISQLDAVDLKSQEGSVTVKIPTSLQAHLKLSGVKIDISQEIQLQDVQEISKDGLSIITAIMNQREEEEKKWITVHTLNGTVLLKSQSWFESLKLQTDVQ